VVNARGASATGVIRAPYEGALRSTGLSTVRLPAGCGCEAVTAPDEYDYVPAPRITSVSTSRDPSHLASENGGTVITIRGRGLNPLVLDWADFGNPSRSASQNTDYVFLSGTRMQLHAPDHPRTLHRARVALSVKTLAGQSAAASALYAGVPVVTGVSTPSSARRLRGAPGASDAGGTPLRVTGRGFAGQVAGALLFVSDEGVSSGTDYAYRVSGDRTISTTTVSQTPGLDDVLVCTVSGCSAPVRADRLWLYAPGDPAVTRLAPVTGPARGGGRVVLHGDNLSCPIGVWFGSARSRKVRPGDAVLDCGSNVLAGAVAPPGTPGARVPVTVQTVESYFTGSGRGTSRARYTYR
jgi:hypothetical protein